MRKSEAAPAGQRDQDIAELLERGAHAAAFERLVERYENKVFRLALSLLRERGLAEDAAQESLLRVWKSLRSYDGRAALSTWIYAITRNRCLTLLEARRAGEALHERVALEAETFEAPAGDSQEALLRGWVEQLPAQYRQTLLLYYYEDRSVEEVADMLALPEGTVKTNLHRGRALLSARLVEEGLSDPKLWLSEVS